GSSSTAFPKREELSRDVLRRLGTARRAGSVGHPLETIRVVDETTHLCSETVAVQLALAHAERRAGLDHGARVRVLVTLHGGAERDEQERSSERERLGDRRSARAADHEIRGGERATHLIAEVRTHDVAVAHLRSEIRPARLGTRTVRLPGDVEDVRTPQDATER